jgi:hypothetical protein
VSDAIADRDILRLTIDQLVRGLYDGEIASVITDKILALPELQGLLALRQAVQDEPEIDPMRSGIHSEIDAMACYHNSIFARLRAVMEQGAQ